MREWIDYFDSAHTIYASARHRDAHFRRIAEDVAAYVTRPGAVVLDYGCGEALHAEIVAAAAGRLILAEPAAGVRARLAARFAGHPSIAVCSLDDVAGLSAGSVDLAVMNSVAQYMTDAEFGDALAIVRERLAPDGVLVLGDIVGEEVSMLTDAAALLRFGLDEGFFVAATVGLVRTAFSNYRRLRVSLGLARYAERAMIARLASAGFAAARAPRNIGHNPPRMTFVARKAGRDAGPASAIR